MAGVHHLLGLDVYLSHVALVGIRCNVQIALVVGGKSAVVGYILGCGNSGAVGADISCISVKATTEENLGFTGQGLAIASHAVCLIEK